MEEVTIVAIAIGGGGDTPLRRRTGAHPGRDGAARVMKDTELETLWDCLAVAAVRLG